MCWCEGGESCEGARVVFVGVWVCTLYVYGGGWYVVVVVCWWYLVASGV